jgi:hypothetical protein
MVSAMSRDIRPGCPERAHCRGRPAILALTRRDVQVSESGRLTADVPKRPLRTGSCGGSAGGDGAELGRTGSRSPTNRTLPMRAEWSAWDRRRRRDGQLDHWPHDGLNLRCGCPPHVKSIERRQGPPRCERLRSCSLRSAYDRLAGSSFRRGPSPFAPARHVWLPVWLPVDCDSNAAWRCSAVGRDPCPLARRSQTDMRSSVRRADHLSLDQMDRSSRPFGS